MMYIHVTFKGPKNHSTGNLQQSFCIYFFWNTPLKSNAPKERWSVSSVKTGNTSKIKVNKYHIINYATENDIFWEKHQKNCEAGCWRCPFQDFSLNPDKGPKFDFGSHVFWSVWRGSRWRWLLLHWPGWRSFQVNWMVALIWIIWFQYWVFVSRLELQLLPFFFNFDRKQSWQNSIEINLKLPISEWFGRKEWSCSFAKLRYNQF